MIKAIFYARFHPEKGTASTLSCSLIPMTSAVAD